MTTGTVRRCGRHEPELWFAEEPEFLVRARAICVDCPARASCPVDVMSRREPWDVWGREIVFQGCVIAHERGRGRPRNDLPPAA